MSNPFDSTRGPPRRSIFDDESDNENPEETDPFLSRSKMTSSIDSHPTPSLGSSQNIARLPSPTALQQDHFGQARGGPPPYETPVRSPPQTRSSYESPANDPWSSTPRTNGTIPVAAPTFPRRVSSIPQASGAAETASYLLDADHINIQKSDEKEGIMGFKHVNYTLASARRGTQVVRRYSDFAWFGQFMPSLIVGYLMLLLNDILSDRFLCCLLNDLLVSFYLDDSDDSERTLSLY
jgi:hypothetical protein